MSDTPDDWGSDCDPRVAISLHMLGRNVVYVGSVSVVKGQSEEAVFRYFLPSFLDVLAKSFPHRKVPLAEAAATLRAAFAKAKEQP